MDFSGADIVIWPERWKVKVFYIDGDFASYRKIGAVNKEMFS